MEAWITDLFGQLPLAVLFVVIAVSLVVLVKGADLLVDQAVTLSIQWGVPKMLIGATIVSIGTTLPEAAVSVLAAVKGAPGLALGNAVGSIIADTGLIMGIAVLVGTVPIDKKMVNRQSVIQAGSALLLVAVSIPYLTLGDTFSSGGRIAQPVGFLLLVLLVLYIWSSIRLSKSSSPQQFETSSVTYKPGSKPAVVIAELAFGIAMVVIGSRILIPAVEETAFRMRIPDSIIAATLVAFGTSLPELVTSLTSVRKGHGELAIGNVLGADVLNVLFVTGASAAVTRGGLQVPPQFFYLFFPSMFFVVAVLRIGITRSQEVLSKKLGFLLLGAYLITVAAGYLV
jgi:cation:H+ antiporter